MLTLGHALEALADYRPTGREPQVSSVVIDSREARKGSVFVAFAGERRDGHDFVADAFRRGASAAIVEKPVVDSAFTIDLARDPASAASSVGTLETPLQIVVEDTMSALQRWAGSWRRRFSVRVTGVTGSVGKTTTKESIYAVLSRRYRTLRSEGNYNNEIGLPLTLLQLRPRHEHAVLEMGMYAPGEIALLCELAQPEIGVVTIIGPVHMSRLGSMEAIFAAKRELVQSLPASGVAILNRDDPRVMEMADHTEARIFTYGLDARANLWADGIESQGLEGVQFTLHHGREAMRVHVPMLGRHSVHTALRAAAVGLVVGMRWEEIIAGLQEEQAQLRLVTEQGPGGALILDDTYNASPESVIAALNLLKDLEGRRIAVLGDMLELGEAEEVSHRLVGRRAARVADVLITVGHRARIIAEEAQAAGMEAARIHHMVEVSEAIPVLEQTVGSGDVVLVKGSRAVALDQIVAALARREFSKA